MLQTNYYYLTVFSALNRYRYLCSRGKHKYPLLIYPLHYRHFSYSNSSESQGEFVDINKTCNRITTSKVIFLSHGFLSNATYYNFSDLAAELVQVIISYT